MRKYIRSSVSSRNPAIDAGATFSPRMPPVTDVQLLKTHSRITWAESVAMAR